MACWFSTRPLAAMQRFFRPDPFGSDQVLLTFNKKILQPSTTPVLLKIIADSLRQILIQPRLSSGYVRNRLRWNHHRCCGSAGRPHRLLIS